jgi:hypothetical protein
MNANDPPEKERIRATIDDETLRAKIRRIIDEPKPESKLKQFTSSPLTALFLGFLLTGIVGVALTNYYNTKQKELEFHLSDLQRDRERERDQRERNLTDARNEQEKLREEAHDDRQKQSAVEHDDRQREIEREKDARQKALEFQRSLYAAELQRERSFADELNKTRVAKISAVWEKIYAYEEGYKNAEDDLQKQLDAKVQWINSGPAFRRLQYRMMVQPIRFAGYDKTTERMLESQILTLIPGFPSPDVHGIFAASDASLKDLMSLAETNMFWLGRDNYSYIKEYVSATRNYIAESAVTVKVDDQAALKKHEEQLTKLAALREKYRVGVTELSSRLLRGPE